MRPRNNKFYFTLLDLLKQGKTPSQISRENNISKQKINYYIRQLKKECVIFKKGYGVWEVKEVKRTTSNTLSKKNSKEVRGHAFIWVIKPERTFDWKTLLPHLGITFSLISNKIPRIMIDGRKIWLSKKSIIIYEPHSFYGKNAIESRKYAVYSLLETIRKLQLALGVKLNPYIFKPSREHYGLIKNDLARQCNRSGEKIHVKDNLEGEWLWIDDSLSLGELETGGIKAMERNIQVQRWWNDMKKHNFEMTPTKTLEIISGVLQTQVMNADNIVKHQKVLDEMLITLKKIQTSLDK